MVDYFALALSHGLLALAAWRLMLRPDLDSDPADGDGDGDRTKPVPKSAFGKPANRA